MRFEPLVIDARDVAAVRSLFTPEAERALCQACGHALDVSPTVLVVQPDGRVHASVGTTPSARSGLDQWLAGRDVDLIEHAGLGALRRRFVEDLAPMVEVAAAAARAATEERLAEWLAENWRELTAEVFAACEAVLSGDVAELDALWPEFDRTRANAPALARQIGQVQAFTWIHLWQSLSAEGTDAEKNDSNTLHAALARYVQQGSVLPGAPEAITGILERFESELEAPALYTLEAIHAVARARAGLENPRSDRWADLFFAYELGALTQPTPELLRLGVVPRVARQTVTFPSAWKAVHRRYHPDGELLRNLEAIATKAGHPGLVHQYLHEAATPDIPSDAPMDVLRSVLDGMAERSVEKTTSAARMLFRVLAAAGRFDDLEELGDYAVTVAGGGADARAWIETGIGSQLGAHRQPRRFLERVGDRPREWEHDASPRPRSALWTERASALRLMGRREDARALIEQVVELVGEDDEHGSGARFNFAVLERETGEPDRAIETLRGLLPSAVAGERIEILESLSITYGVVGRIVDALHATDEAIALVAGVAGTAERQARLRSWRASLLAALGQREEAIRELSAIELEGAGAAGIIACAASWFALLEQNAEGIEAAQIQAVADRVTSLGNDARARGDVNAELNCVRLLAILTEALGLPEAESYWRRGVAIRAELGEADPLDLAALARYEFAAGHRAEGRELLAGIPDALAGELGGVTDPTAAIQGTTRLGRELRRLATVLRAAGGDWSDLRVAAELQRDAIGRARRLRSARHVAHTLPSGLTLDDEVLAGLASSDRGLAVVEWIADEGQVSALFTRIDPDGNVASSWLTTPSVDLREVASAVRSRLDGWLVTTAGDPFDDERWRSLEAWLQGEIARFAAKGDHVVFIEHPSHAGLPWHVGVAGHWTTSYIASWSELLRLKGTPQAEPIRRLGHVGVPRAAEGHDVEAALRASSSRSAALADVAGIDFEAIERESADRRRVLSLLERCDALKVLCHGYVGRGDHEVALMLASAGALPLADSKAAASPVARDHQLSWRHCQELSAAPRLVLSAACSSGMTHLAGLGERLGLLGALREAGTRSLIAPLWDVDPTAVAPILDDILERHVVRHEPLAQALDAACRQAATHHPRWLAWALALEGEWE